MYPKINPAGANGDNDRSAQRSKYDPEEYVHPGIKTQIDQCSIKGHGTH
jgi:hypothetical protein